MQINFSCQIFSVQHIFLHGCKRKQDSLISSNSTLHRVEKTVTKKKIMYLQHLLFFSKYYKLFMLPSYMLIITYLSIYPDEIYEILTCRLIIEYLLKIQNLL